MHADVLETMAQNLTDTSTAQVQDENTSAMVQALNANTAALLAICQILKDMHYTLQTRV